MAETVARSERQEAVKKIQQIVIDDGPSTTTDLWDKASSRGFISPKLQWQLARRGGIELCRTALKQKSQNGLPFALPMDGSRNPLWQRLTLFNCDQLEASIRRDARGVYADMEELRLRNEYMFDRFGKRVADIPWLIDRSYDGAAAAEISHRPPDIAWDDDEPVV